jgi:hypothetical protein
MIGDEFGFGGRFGLDNLGVRLDDGSFRRLGGGVDLWYFCDGRSGVQSALAGGLIEEEGARGW